MNSDHNSKVEVMLFELALQQPTAVERAAFLDANCQGNPSLRAGVEKLIAIHFGHAGFLPGLERTPPDSRASPRPDPPPSSPGDASPLHP